MKGEALEDLGAAAIARPVIVSNEKKGQNRKSSYVAALVDSIRTY